MLDGYRQLLTVRREALMPRLPGRRGHALRMGPRLLEVGWDLDGGARWHLLANLGGPPAAVTPPYGHAVFCSASPTDPVDSKLALPSWSVAAFLES